MTSWTEWKKADEEYARDFSRRMDDMTPEPLFESCYLPAPKVCLRCARREASSLLYSPFGMQPVLPLCSDCAVDWNFAGYGILRGITAKRLLWRLAKFKMMRPFRRPSIADVYTDVKNFLRWANKMKRLRSA